MKTKYKLFKLIVSLLTAIIAMFALIGCDIFMNGFDMRSDKESIVTISINEGVGRTIIPPAAAFTKYELDFYEESVFAFDRTMTSGTQTLKIPHGNYSVEITGFVGSNVVAQKTVPLNVPVDTSLFVTLEPVDGYGTFVWNFSSIASIDIDSILLYIDDEVEPYDLNELNDIPLAAGSYILVFELTKGSVTREWFEVLYIYAGLTTTYIPTWSALLFTEHNENEMEVEAILSALSAGSFIEAFFTYTGVQGVDEDNFNDVKDAFNIIKGSAVPTTLDEVKAIVDASLVTIGIAEDYVNQAAAETAVLALRKNGTNVDFDYDEETSVLTVTVGIYPIYTNIITYSVTYNGNEHESGSVPVDPKRYIYGSEFTVLDNTGNLEIEGFRFIGWNTQEDGEGIDYAVGSVHQITGDLILYAYWLEGVFGLAVFENNIDIIESGGILTFAGQTYGYPQQVEKTVTVENTDDIATGILTITLSGSGMNDFTVSTTILGSLNIEGETTFAIRPNNDLGAGVHSATVTITDGRVHSSFVVSFTVAKAVGSFGTPSLINTTFTTTLTLADLEADLAAGYVWDTPSTSLNAGDGQAFAATFTHPSGNYESATGSITVNVAKAIGSFGTPSAVNTTFTETLTLEDLEADLAAGYVWDTPSTSLSAGDGQSFAATFTHPSGNYESATGSITVNVAKATGNFGTPSAINTIFTETLTLEDLEADLAAGYVWDDPSTSLSAGDTQSFAATFTHPSGNYESATGSITVNVAKATGNFGTPSVVNTTFTETLTLEDLEADLAAGYVWDTPSTSLSAGNAQSFAATFTHPSGNYEAATGSITVNVAKADGAVLSAPTLEEKAPRIITVNTVTASTGQTVEYGISETNAAANATWQAGTTFIGLTPDTPYFFFVRAVGNSNYENGNASSALSVSTDPLPIESFTIGFNQLQNLAPEITGPTLNLVGKTTDSITVESPELYVDGSIKYYLNGVQLTTVTGDSGETLNINTATALFSGIGTYKVTVEVIAEADSKRYSNIITITVRP